MKKSNYISSDFKRAFLSYRFIIGFIGVILTLFLSIYKMMPYKTSVYTIYINAIFFIPFTLSLVFCTLPYVGVFCEDLENNYIYLSVLRGNLKKYVISKILTIYLSSILTMVIGILGFISLIHFIVPWTCEYDILHQDILTYVFFDNKFYFLYYLAHAFFLGLLSANLSIISSYVSLFWRNKLLLMSLPFIIYYFCIYYVGWFFINIPQFDISLMFNPSYNVWKNELLSFLWPFFVSCIFVVLIGFLIYKKLEKMYNE